MSRSKPALSLLYSAFFKIGLFTFGGGYAMLPMLEKECVDNYKWITSADLLDYFAISQCTPGVIAVNTATFVGYRKRGTAGALSATLGVITPSLIIILLLASIIHIVRDNAVVLRAFSGIRIAVCALILKSVVNISLKSIKNFSSFFIAVLAFLSQYFGLISPAVAVLLILLFGFLSFLFTRKNGNGGKK